MELQIHSFQIMRSVFDMIRTFVLHRWSFPPTAAFSTLTCITPECYHSSSSNAKFKSIALGLNSITMVKPFSSFPRSMAGRHVHFPLIFTRQYSLMYTDVCIQVYELSLIHI